MAKKTPLNEWQKLVAQVYGGGDYAHHETLEETQDIGDGLYTFLQRDLDASEDCTEIKYAIRRVRGAIADLQVIEAALTAKALR